MREDYRTSVIGAQRELLQQNPSGRIEERSHLPAQPTLVFVLAHRAHVRSLPAHLMRGSSRRPMRLENRRNRCVSH